MARSNSFARPEFFRVILSVAKDLGKLRRFSLAQNDRRRSAMQFLWNKPYLSGQYLTRRQGIDVDARRATKQNEEGDASAKRFDRFSPGRAPNALRILRSCDLS